MAGYVVLIWPIVQLISCVNVLMANMFMYLLDYHPDNDKIIFIARALDGSTNEFLFMSDIDGTNVHALLPDSTVSSCDWSK